MLNGSNILSYIKQLIFQFFFILQYNSITNKHILILIQLLQLLPLIFFYLNPVYSHLSSFSLFSTYLNDFYPKLIFITGQKQQIISLIFLLITPSIFIGLIIMKYFVGYQYILVLIMEIWLLVYPVFFVKIVIECVNVIVSFQHVVGIGVVLVVANIIWSLFILQYYGKMYKYIDVLPIILIFMNVHPYACLSIVFIKIILSYILSPVSLIRNLRLSWQLSLLIIIFTCYFCSDILTNMISFTVLIFTFVSPQIFRIFNSYHKFQPIFYHLQNMITQQQQKLYLYQYLQNHRISCVNLKCVCRQISSQKNDQIIQEKGYKLVEQMYKFKEDFISRIELGRVCYQKYDYSLSGLLDMFQIKPQNIYQQYRVYYNKTVYEQQFRKNDKNYSFGQKYFNVYEQYRQFQQSIENLTLIIKKFWQEILNFDGSRKFLELIIEISEKINNINEKYEIYNDKYEQYPQFKYLYTTFQIAILNILNSNDNINTNSSKRSSQINSMNQPLNIKIPDRQLFFISLQGKIINCNRDFCNFLQINKTQILNKSYDMFIPQIYHDVHKQWQSKFFSQYNKQQTKQTYKTFRKKNQYIKCVKMSNKILPRFQQGIQIITFIKLVNNLQTIAKGPQSESHKQGQNFFSFLIEKQTLKIVCMDESFFYANDININEQLRKKILSIKITDIYPKFTLKQQSQNSKHDNKSFKQVILNYKIINEFTQKKQKQLNSMLSMNSRSPQFYSNNNMSINSGMYFMSQNSNIMNSPNIMNMIQNGPQMSRRKSRAKSGFSNGLIQKQKTQFVFFYQVIQQLNKQINIEYCIINFKTKTKTNYDMQFINQFKKRISIFGNQQNIKKQFNNINNNINNNFRNNNINNSNINNTLSNEPQISSTGSSDQQKTSCLPWIILLPLILIHLIFMSIIYLFNQVLIFMLNSFSFYKMYQLTILKLLNLKQFSSIDYLQNMKTLWIQGYGYYHESMLIFEKYYHQEQFKVNLIEEVIKINHIGIYRQIEQIINGKYSLIHGLELTITIILIIFIVYIVIDFILNILYTFRTYKKVVQIILIFLNIQKHDVNRMVLAIDMYQHQILQMYYYNKDNDKINKQIYLFDQNYDSYLNNNNAENSIINLNVNLNKDSFRFNQTFRDNNLFIDGEKKYQQNNKKTGLKEKIDIEVFKKKMEDFKNNIQQKNNANNNNMIINNNNNNNLPLATRPSPHCASLSPQKNSFQYSPKINQPQQQQQQKILQICKFKQKYTQKCNQIKQNLNVYILIFIGFILCLLVFGIALIFLLQWVYNYQQYGDVYENIQMMNIVVFKQLIHKVTGIQLQPKIKMSEFNRNYFIKQSQLLTQLPQYQLFWQSVYKNNVCPLISQLQLQSICIKLDNSIVNFGQKVISQYLQQYLRLNSVSNLLDNSLLSTKQFLNVVKIQLNLINSGQTKLYQNILNYLNKTSNYQLIICCLGTLVLFVAILLLRKALNQIKSKINDGENLLLIVPEKIKIKYMHKNQNQQKLKYSKDKNNKNKNKKFKMKINMPVISQIQCSASSLVTNSQGKSSPIKNIKK